MATEQPEERLHSASLHVDASLLQTASLVHGSFLFFLCTNQPVTLHRAAQLHTSLHSKCLHSVCTLTYYFIVIEFALQR